MRFEPDQIYGAVTLRELKRYLSTKQRIERHNPTAAKRWFVSELNLSPADAEKSYDALVAAHFFAPPPGNGFGDVGARFTGTHFGPSLTRQEAIDLVNAICQLALRHNATSETYYVEWVKVFGSILTDAPILNDLDISLHLMWVQLPGETIEDALHRIENRNTSCLDAIKPQCAFRTIQRRIMRKFDALSPAISQHSFGSLAHYETNGAISAIIFRDARQPNERDCYPVFKRHTKTTISVIGKAATKPKASKGRRQ